MVSILTYSITHKCHTIIDSPYIYRLNHYANLDIYYIFIQINKFCYKIKMSISYFHFDLEYYNKYWPKYLIGSSGWFFNSYFKPLFIAY